MSDSLAKRIRDYKNTAANNDDLHQEFTNLTDTVPYLKEHRDFVERTGWGFGDRAFHYMWLLLLIDAAQHFKPVRLLEIGVYKGQVISLWSLIAKELQMDVEITAISPFEGNAKPESGLRQKMKWLLDSKYRNDLANGNIYPASDYIADVRRIFSVFDIDDKHLRLVKGYSNDPFVIKQIQSNRFSLVYVDGDHDFEAVRSDISTYALLVEDEGYLVMDDASFFLPGESFFKGHKNVSLACEEIPVERFKNVLNVGHNRVYKRVS